MKLWHKVFLVSLLFIIFSMDSCLLLVQYDNFTENIESETDRAVSSYGFISAAISKNVVIARMKQTRPLLTCEQTDSAIRQAVATELDSYTVYVYRENEAVYRPSEISDDEIAEYMKNLTETSKVVTYICESGGKTYLLAGSVDIQGGIPYTVFYAADLTHIYERYDENVRSTLLISLALALIISLALYVAVYAMFAPMRRAMRTLYQMASGDYSLRMKASGGAEFRELAESVNAMAQATEKNIDSLKNIAEGRRQFVDNFAHEMKTPLTAILGYADIMRVKKTVSDAERREYAGIIVEESKRLKSLSGKLLTLATTENADVKLETVNVRTLFDEVSSSVTPILIKRHIQLICIPQNVYIKADGELFKSLLYNLIDNSIKASKSGGEIRLSCRESDGRAAITVSDDGIGMTAAQVKHVTEPFYMVDKSRSRKEGGAGLGLALCMEIARRHNADLKIDSAPGKGTAVTVVVDCAKEADGNEADK